MANPSVAHHATSKRAPRVLGSVLAAALLVVAGCATNAPTAQAQLGSGGKTTKVELKKLKFTPKTVQVRAGDKIDFVWKETVAHNVVFKGGPKSKTLNKGTWSTSFEKAGSYKYKCTLHPGMDGTIVVK
jgi:plastocyanin